MRVVKVYPRHSRRGAAADAPQPLGEGLRSSFINRYYGNADDVVA